MADVVAATTRPPWQVMAYLPVEIAGLIAFYAASGTDFQPLRVLWGLVLPVAITIGLWRRRRFAWWIGVVLNVLSVGLGVANYFSRNTAMGVAQFVGGLILLGLLLQQAARRWCAIGEERP